MSKKKLLFSFSLSLFVGISQLSAPLVYAAQVDEVEESVVETAPDGLTIEGQDISGMNSTEISSIISHEVERYDNTKFTLTAEGQKVESSGSDLALCVYNDDIVDKAVNYGKKGNLIERYMQKSDIEANKGKDFSLLYTSDEKKTEKYLEENAPHLDTEPTNNSIVRENGEFKFIEGKPGIVVDYENSAKKISDFITCSWKGDTAEIALEVIKQEPKGSREELMAVKDLLGSCSTDFSTSSSARAANVKNGTSKLNESLIFPGEEFSVSTNLEARNAENGYLPAPSYENGTTVDTYGGGVCQISTTLYNAVIKAELEIVERHPHSMIVSYVKPSMDAAISEGSKDFVFKNNLNYPIYIEGYTSGGMLNFNIYGKEERASGRTVEYVSEVLSSTDPGERYIEDVTLPPGTIIREQGAHVGHTAQLWKIVKEGGVETSKKVFNKSTYRAGDAIYRVGSGGDPGISAAIATQDRGVIDAAIGGGGGSPEPAPEPTQDPSPAPESTPAQEPETTPESIPVE